MSAAPVLRYGLRAGTAAAAIGFHSSQRQREWHHGDVQCEIKKQTSRTKIDKNTIANTLLYKNYVKRYGDSKTTQLFFADVKGLLNQIGITDAYLASRIFRVMDEDNSGSVTYDEMAKFCGLLGHASTEIKMKFIFDACDLNHNGQIEAQEMRQFLKHVMLNCMSTLPHFVLVSDERDVAMFADFEIDEIATVVANRLVYDIFKVADADKGGTIDFKEFSFWYKRGDKTAKALQNLFGIFDVLASE